MIIMVLQFLLLLVQILLSFSLVVVIIMRDNECEARENKTYPRIT